MKIGILTHYNVYNQGAQLQMLSLKKYLEEKGHTVYILTYEKNFDFDTKEKSKNSGSFKAAFYYIKNYLFGKGLGLTLFNVRKVKAHNRFLKNYSFLPYDADGLDAVIVGSDEVYSIDVGFNKMMYGYGIKAPVIAYAPAFGRAKAEDLKERGVEEVIAEGLKGCYSLSARDVHTKEMVETLTGREVPMVCDPVILYDGKTFPVGKRPIKNKYLIVYSYDRNMTDKSEIAAIKSYAKQRGLKTLSLGTYHAWCDKSIPLNCEDWYSYFSEAECVITDTFHGYVVSLKNKCNVALFIRPSINAFKLCSIAEETGTGDRIMSSVSVEELCRVLDNKPDYEEVDKRLSEMRKNSEKYLIGALKGLEK